MIKLIPSVKKMDIKEGFLSTRAIKYPECDLDPRILNALSSRGIDKIGG